MSDQTITGRKSMSLEQQVRIAAGTFVLISAVLTYFVHPYFVGLTAFFGTGLIFAGITNTCVMFCAGQTAVEQRARGSRLLRQVIVNFRQVSPPSSAARSAPARTSPASASGSCGGQATSPP